MFSHINSFSILLWRRLSYWDLKSTAWGREELSTFRLSLLHELWLHFKELCFDWMMKSNYIMRISFPSLESELNLMSQLKFQSHDTTIFQAQQLLTEENEWYRSSNSSWFAMTCWPLDIQYSVAENFHLLNSSGKSPRQAIIHLFESKAIWRMICVRWDRKQFFFSAQNEMMFVAAQISFWRISSGNNKKISSTLHWLVEREINSLKPTKQQAAALSVP